ncbi:MAG: protein-disulfide reductase DsbD domain-containing protein [Ruegeria sp.]
MKMLCSFVAAALLACVVLAAPLRAQAIDNIVRLEVLDGGKSEDGTYLGAIQLNLQEGWKTYWRAPGDAGIPPEFDWRRSGNVGSVSIIWPAPHVFDQNGLKSIGYVDQLVLPIRITPRNPAEPVHLRGEMDLGICKDVCIPASLDFDHSLDANAGRNPTIAAALAQRPYSAREAGVKGAACVLAPTADGMQISVRINMPTAGGTELTVIEPGNPALWASQAETTRQGKMLVATSEVISADGGPIALDRSAIRITVLGTNHAVDILGCTAG